MFSSWSIRRSFSFRFFSRIFNLSLILFMTWRQTVMAELREMGLTWGEAQASDKDRTLWRKIVVALCPTGDEED